jgi:cell division protease FtsH
VKQLVTDNYDRARRILTEHMASLIALAEALLAKEVLDAFDIKHVLVQPSAGPVPA